MKYRPHSVAPADAARLGERLVCLLLIAAAGFSYTAVSRAQPGMASSLEGLPEAAYEELEMLNVRDADLRDVLRGIAHEYGLNMIVDNRIERRVTVRLGGLPVVEAVSFLCSENGLDLSRTGPILRIGLPPEPEPPAPEPPRVSVRDGLLAVELNGEELGDVVPLLVRQSGRNVVVRRGVRGALHGMLSGVPFELGLRTLMQNNGFSLRESDGIFFVDRAGFARDEGDGARSFHVEVTDSTVSFDVADARIADLLHEIGAQREVSLVTYQEPEGTITGRIDDLPFEDALGFLLKGTNVTYRREGGVYVVGSKETNGIAATRLIRLDHIRADAVLELIPETIRANATIQVVREHNGLMVTGTNDLIVELTHFVRELDYPTPQILIEAIVVDFEATDLFELGVRLGWQEGAAAAATAEGEKGAIRFQTGDGENRGFTYSGNGSEANGHLDALNALTGFFGVRKLGRLPADFYFRIHALSLEGKANIRSRPQIATLNGHTASISIGTTQYYILETSTPYQQPGQLYVQSTQRFEKIEANVRLEITPWVSASGEVTTEIRPEFSTPVGELNPEVPPTINSRVLDSTVRLHDGETIILGGLIQDASVVSYDKVPVLGSIPLIGRLFRSTSRKAKKSELMIFLTPHVFYGDERDDEKWRKLRDALDLTDSDHRSLGYTRFKR